RICEKLLHIDDRVVSLAMIIAAQPDRDVLRSGDFVTGELVTCNLGNVQHDLRPRCRDRIQCEYQCCNNTDKLYHDFSPARFEPVMYPPSRPDERYPQDHIRQAIVAIGSAQLERTTATDRLGIFPVRLSETGA